MSFVNLNYPMLCPYVGSNFRGKAGHRLLLVGESHYLPENSTQHHSPDAWYSGTHLTLTPEEIAYINTSEIISTSRQSRFSNKAHSIYRNSFFEINRHGPAYDDYMLIADDIAFCNYFIRPALKGKSLIVQPLDITKSEAAFSSIVNALSPTAIIFLSKHAFRFCHYVRTLSIPFTATPHPGSAWWNKTSAKYDHMRGRDVLISFLTNIKYQ